MVLEGHFFAAISVWLKAALEADTVYVNSEQCLLDGHCRN